MATLEKKQFIGDLRNKDDIKSIFLVKYISKMSARDGKTYINLIAQDSTGEIECRIWNNADEIMSRVHLGEYVQVQGKVNVFQGKKQVIIEEINVIEKDAIEALLPEGDPRRCTKGDATADDDRCEHVANQLRAPPCGARGRLGVRLLMRKKTSSGAPERFRSSSPQTSTNGTSMGSICNRDTLRRCGCARGSAALQPRLC